jgi:putative hydrolase of the HAD superfamily
VAAVTFDFGQTLAELDTALLSARLAERSMAVDAGALEAAQPAAWRAYNAAVLAAEPVHPWHRFMRELLRCAGARDEPAGAVDAAVDFLWEQQPLKNLWRRPVPGMFELVRSLRGAGMKLGVISNSEGKLAELAGELGIREAFDVMADSGAVGIEKPDPRIFDWAASGLGVEPRRIVHVGDSWPADVQGALAAGFGAAIWFRGGALPADDQRIATCADAAGVRRALAALGIHTK